MRVTSLQEPALIAAIFKDPNNWALERLLECTSIDTCRTFKESTLLLIWHFYKHNQVIMKWINKEYFEKKFEPISY